MPKPHHVCYGAASASVSCQFGREEDKGADGSGGEAAEADSSKEADPNEDAPAP